MKNSSAGNTSGSRNSASSPAFDLAGDEAQVWSASLERPAHVVARFSALLSPDETTRAERFYFERDRAHYIVGRGLLRMILGGYLGMNPARIEFDYGPYGKPALKTNHSENPLQFNLAHSKDRVLYIVSLGFPVGIDVEHVRPLDDEDALARHVFAPSEVALVTSLSGQQKHETFFKFWTCKEAVLKTTGHGLMKPLDQTEIVLAEESARLASLDGDPQKAVDWHLQLFKPDPEYQAALAFEGRARAISFRQVDDYFTDIISNANTS